MRHRRGGVVSIVRLVAVRCDVPGCTSESTEEGPLASVGTAHMTARLRGWKCTSHSGDLCPDHRSRWGVCDGIKKAGDNDA